MKQYAAAVEAADSRKADDVIPEIESSSFTGTTGTLKYYGKERSILTMWCTGRTPRGRSGSSGRKRRERHPAGHLALQRRHGVAQKTAMDVIRAMSGLLNTVVNATLISALYAFVAIGFTLIFGVGGVLNLSHGAIITIGAFTAYFVTGVLGANIWVATLAALVISAAFAAILYLVLIRRVQHDSITVMILTLVTAIVVEEAVKILVGTQPRAIPSLFSGHLALVGGIQLNRVFAFTLSWVVIGCSLPP